MVFSISQINGWVEQTNGFERNQSKQCRKSFWMLLMTHSSDILFAANDDSFKGFNLQETTPINGENHGFQFPAKIFQRKPIQWAVWWLASFFRKKWGHFRIALYIWDRPISTIQKSVYPGTSFQVVMEGSAWTTLRHQKKNTIRYHHRSNKETYSTGTC